MILIICEYPCGKRFQTVCTVVKSQQTRAVKTMQALLSFIMRLYAGLPGILTLKNNVGTQPLLLFRTWFSNLDTKQSIFVIP